MNESNKGTKKSVDSSKDDSPVTFPWHAHPKEECFRQLGCDVSKIESVGLDTEQAAARLQKYGPNRLAEKEKVTLLQRIWKQVANVLVAILVFVAIVSAIRAATAAETQNKITNWIQVGLITFVITVNTTIGIIQEGNAEKAAEALRAMLSSDAVVIRDAKEIKIRAQDVVPGDMVKISTGDRVPADLRMCAVNNLAAQEAALTGESVPIDKVVEAIESPDGDPNKQPLGDRHNMCFSATMVAQGSGKGIAVATGDHTEIGTINALVNKIEAKKTNVLKQIDEVSKWLAIFIALASAGTWCIAFFITDMDGIDALTTSLVCAVAMIPEGLEAIVTMTYAWAVSNMAKKNAIIRALPAVETLGSVTVICSDKTGTLTKNEMSLVAFVTAGKRFKFNVHATERTTRNVVVDNLFMAERADHSKLLRRSEVIRLGPNVMRKSRRGRSRHSFPFAISQHFLNTNNGEEENVVPESVDRDNHLAEQSDMLDDEPDAETMIIRTNQNKNEDSHTLETLESDTHQSEESPDASFVRKLLGGGILCSKCVLGEGGGRDGEIGNPTELSILRAAYFGQVDVMEVKKDSPVIAEVPFSSDYKFMATVHRSVVENDTFDCEGKLVVHVKGAPDRLLPFCKFQSVGGSILEIDQEPCDTNFWLDQIAILSSQGLRVLALMRATLREGSVAEGEQLGPAFITERKEPWLTIVGLCAIMDPPRPECVQAVHEAHSAGVRVVMITGDHKDTAIAIGAALGIVDQTHPDAITGSELDGMSEDTLRVAAQKFNVFARASPQNKILIVKALQSEGDVCGMTGDGVNDAPALKAADMGVAMGKEGTDVAREASDMILADDNFATIIAAVREGRVVWDNLRKVLLVNTPINNAQGMSVLFGLLFGLKKSPLTSIQVLYSNLICAVTLGFVCAVEPAEDGILEQPPRIVGKRLIGRFLLLRILIGTFTLVCCVVGSVFWAKDEGYSEEEQHSQGLNVLNFGAIAITMSARFARNSALHRRTFHGNALAWYSYVIMLFLQVFITYTPGLNMTIFEMLPMDIWQWGLVLLGMVITFTIMEFEKAIRNYLHELKYDVYDLELGPFDSRAHRNTPLPAEIARFARH